MKCPSSCPLNFYEFPFFKTSVARLEPEQFEVWSTFVGFVSICLMAQGDRQLANDDDDDSDAADDDDGDDDDDHHHHRHHHQPQHQPTQTAAPIIAARPRQPLPG